MSSIFSSWLLCNGNNCLGAILVLKDVMVLFHQISRYFIHYPNENNEQYHILLN